MSRRQKSFVENDNTLEKQLRIVPDKGIDGRKSGCVGKRRLCTLHRTFPGLSVTWMPGVNHDTDGATYRCFLPDLTRFVVICCVAAGQGGIQSRKSALERGFSPA